MYGANPFAQDIRVESPWCNASRKVSVPCKMLVDLINNLLALFQLLASENEIL
jgi:hypothetical protein